MAYRNTEATGTTPSGTNNNLNPHPPESNRDLDIFASTSLKDSQDKHTLLRNIGYLRGIRVDSNDAPQTLMRQVATFVEDGTPIVQEINDFVTETITTKTQRQTNYIHHGWSIAAASATSPWISSRIAANNQHNSEGTWVTRRALVQRLRVRVAPRDLVPAAEFTAEMEAALKQSTIFKRFEAVYQVFHDWGDVVPLEIEMGASLAFTDLEANMSQLPAIATWTNTHYLATIRTARTTSQGGAAYWDKDIMISLTRFMAPRDWRQIRISEVMDTTRLLPVEIQYRLSQLYTQRLSCAPVIARGDDSKTHDDTPFISMDVSSVTVYATAHIRSITFSYADKVTSSKHEGSDTGGSEHEFVLTDGEHITEMLVWKGDWVYGLQFVTNFGRCSLHFGGNWGIPTMARSRGGVLVGAASLIKKDQAVFRFQAGIWRHDIIDTIPKEEDLHSDYFGSQYGKPFNDRGIVRNSDIAISKIDLGCGSVIDSLQVTYHDSWGHEIQTERHGGLGGRKNQFVLEPGEHIPGEHIVSVSGRYDDRQITQMTFVTDKGRSSDVFGQGNSTGESRPFSVASPKDNEGKRMRLQYVCGKSEANLNGIMFAWTPMQDIQYRTKSLTAF
ncbi:hypothetical protein RSAG8_11087, partial [Rhizoctonia solani AG-8 WAC10335]